MTNTLRFEWPREGKTWELVATNEVLWIDADGTRWATYLEGIATSPDGRVQIRIAADEPQHLVPVEVRFMGDKSRPIKVAELRVALTDQMKLQAKRMIRRGSWSDDGEWVLRFLRDDVQDISDAHAAQSVRPRRRLTPEFLRNEVAPVIASAEAAGRPYSEALCAAFADCNPEKARKWRKALKALEAQS